jgi:ABC-type nitrate/sulfonate/bicarbonate transport system substrate-binding protein
MTRPITRRRLLTAGMGAVALGALPGVHAVSLAVAAETPVRLATALRAAFQSLGWVGAEAGMFRRHGIEVTFPSLEAGGPGAVTKMLGGEWEFAHTGDVPIVQGVLQGHDPVLLLTPTDLHEGVFVMARRDITRPEQLAGTRIGAVDQTGQLGRAMQRLLQQWGVSATLISLGSFQAIYAALGKGEVEAGYLPVDLRFRGQNEFGWTALQSLPAGTGGIVTTRRFVAAHRDIVAGIVKGFVDTIHLFKTRRDTVVPLLQRFLQFPDRPVVEELHAFYVPIFRAVPRPTLFAALPNLRDAFAKQYPAAQHLQPQDLADASFVDELEQSGYIQRLYTGDTKH